MNRGSRLLVALAITALAAVGAVTAWELSAKTDENDGVGRDQVPATSLYQRAKNEGTVSIWATNAEDLQWIPQAFDREFPGVKVQIFTDLNVATRVITESRAGRYDADVVWNSEALVRPLIERDLLIRDEWPVLGVRAEDVGADGRMAITSSVAFAVAYRVDRVSLVDVPSKWTDLSEQKYRGKMAASPILFARLTAALGAFEGKEKWQAYTRAIREASQTLWSNDLLEQTIVSGERPYVVATANYLAERWKKRGLPVEVVLPEPVFVTQFGSVVLKNAPHPNAARLLAAWMAGPSGRQARETALLAVDLRPTSRHPKARELRESGKKLYVDTTEAMDRRTALIPEMDRIMTGL